MSQHLDVLSFHALRSYTDGAHLWLRNLASTSTSQLVDTVLFITLAFWAVPSAIGLGTALPGTVLLQLVIGQYVVKLLIAVVDTPVIYAVVGSARSHGFAQP